MFSTKQSMPVDYIENFKKKIRESNVAAIKELIRFAEVNHYDLNANDPKSKYTLLHFAISRTTEENENQILEILNLLENQDCDINKAALDSYNNTPIHTASRRALPEIALWLIENGANINVTDTSGQTALNYVDKQINCSGEHRNIENKNRLIKIKNILTKNEEVVSHTVQQQYGYKNLCRLSLFAVVCVFAGANIYMQNKNNMGM